MIFQVGGCPLRAPGVTAVTSGMLRRLALAGLAALLLASCSSGDDSSSPDPTTPLLDTTTTSALPNTPVIGRILSPERASVQGSGGRGMVVALSFTARDATVLPATFRLGGALPSPAPAVKPGHNPAFPGLVVTLSTTGTALGGPSANLANLFQIVSPALQLDGSMHVFAVWTNNQVDFGSDVDTVLTAYVLPGTAPDVVPPTQANLDVISNPLEVTFRVSPVTDPAAAAAAASAAAAGASTTTVAGATTTSIRATSTTRPTSTTGAPATTRPTTATTAPAPSTTRCTIILLGTPC